MNDAGAPDPVASAIAAPEQELQVLRHAVQRLEQAERLQHALYSIADLAGAGLDMPQMLAGVHAVIGELMPAENFYIALHDEEAAAIVFLYFADVDSQPPALGERVPLAALEHGLTWWVIRLARPLRGTHAELSRQVPGPLRVRGVASTDWLGVPMMEDAKVRGVLVVQSYARADLYDDAAQALLGFVASHVLTALQRKRAQDGLEYVVRERTAELARANREMQVEVQARQRGERLQSALYRIAELASSPVSTDEFHRAVHGVVGSLLNASNYFVALPRDNRVELDVPYSVDERDPIVPVRPLGKGLTARVLATEAPLLVDRAGVRALEAQGLVEVWGATPLSWLGVPLRCEGRTLGVLAVQSYTAEVTYTEPDRELLVFVSHQIASSLQRRQVMQALQQANAELEQRVAERTRELREQIVERERIEQRLKHEVVHDALTGLPNRNYLRDRIERLLRARRRDPSHHFAVMFLDMDRFKVINDSIGHHAGDTVLREMATRLGAVLREPDFVARLGGDEFAVLVEDASDADAVAHVAQRLLCALQPPMQVAGRELVISSSVGIALCSELTPTAEDLLRHADTAMYRAKSNGRNRFEFYDEQLHEGAMRVLDLEGELREALRLHQFEPYFQPVVRLDDGAIVGCETLMRWRHPQRGLLAPAEFLKVAEDNGSIEAIDWQIYDAAFAAAARASEFTGLLGINVAPRHLRHADFGARILALIEQHGLPPRRICLEITEGTLIEDPERTAAQLHALRRSGLTLALDDFGTGYSCLGHLHHLPLAVLKIDRSFVSSLGGPETDGPGHAVVRAVVALAGSVRMGVVAEGVETEAQRRALLAMGCTRAQGYLFGRPAPTLPRSPAPAAGASPRG